MARSPLLLLVALGSLAAPLVAQSSVTADRPLLLGIVVAGTSTSVGPASASAAQWHIQGTVVLSANFHFTLPTTLTRSGGSETMAISFCGTCAIRNTTSNPATGTTFNPTTTQTISGIGSTTIWVWLGGSVSPPVAQVPGTYTGTVVLTATGLL